jgi:hypothetical protein
VITYVASYYHTFSKMKAGATGGKRIGNIVSKIRDIESQQIRYSSPLPRGLAALFPKSGTLSHYRSSTFFFGGIGIIASKNQGH